MKAVAIDTLGLAVLRAIVGRRTFGADDFSYPSGRRSMKDSGSEAVDELIPIVHEELHDG